MEFRGDANQRIARISAHLQPSFNPQMEAKNSVMGRENCRAKGGNPGFKVAILGAAGGIGQSLSLLMKMNPLVSLLHLYDVVNAPGVTADVSHMDTGAVVRGFLGQKQLEDALTGMDLVIIPAGVPRKPGMTRDDLFKINAGIVKTLCEGVAKCCPNAIVNLISNPVNSTVPIAAEVFKKAGTYDPKKLLGVTTLDVARANTFVAEVLGLDPREVDVPVVGGHAGVTILPLLSQVKPPSSFTPQEIEYLTNRIQNGGTEVVEAKAGAGSATLSMAYAAAKFADACLRGLRGDANVVECSFVASQVTELAFFATKVRLGRTGAEEVYQLGPLNEYERIGLEKAKEELAAFRFNISKIMAATRVITAATAVSQTTSCFLAKRAFVLPAKKSCGGGFGGLCFNRRALVLKSKRPFSCSAIYNPQVKVQEEGQPDSLDYRVFFLDGSGKKVSPWHDIPLTLGDGVFNFIVEIPKESKAKMEVATEEDFTPIKQDTKKGKLRYYPYNINWNYGLLPQTWEDPSHANSEVEGCFGDNDPVDVVEIGETQRKIGDVLKIKPLAALAMIDEGELDWKIVAISLDDPKAHLVNDVDDVEKHFPGTLTAIRDWFRDYKIPDGKPANRFGLGDKPANKDYALKIIHETNESWAKLVKRSVDAGDLSLF